MKDDIKFILGVYKDIIWGPGPILKLNSYQYLMMIGIIGILIQGEI